MPQSCRQDTLGIISGGILSSCIPRGAPLPTRSWPLTRLRRNQRMSGYAELFLCLRGVLAPHNHLDGRLTAVEQGLERLVAADGSQTRCLVRNEVFGLKTLVHVSSQVNKFH